VHGPVAVGNKSFTSPIKQLVVEFGRTWSGNVGERDDRVGLIVSGNAALATQSNEA